MTDDGDESTRELDPEDAVYRRFLPGQWITDANLGRKRLSSAAFERRDGEEHVSCYVESIMTAAGLVADRVLDGHVGFGNARIGVSVLNDHEYAARPDPEGIDPSRPHSCDIAHGAILSPDLSVSALRKRAAKLAKDDRIDVLAEPTV